MQRVAYLYGESGRRPKQHYPYVCTCVRTVGGYFAVVNLSGTIFDTTSVDNWNHDSLRVLVTTGHVRVGSVRKAGQD